MSDVITWIFQTTLDLSNPFYHTTIFVTFVLAWTLFSFQRRVLVEETWAKYLSYFFATVFIMYIFIAASSYFEAPLIKTIGMSIGSPVNNLFLFAAAQSLWGKETLFPRSVIWLAFICGATSLFELIIGDQWGTRLFDGWCSVFVMCYLGLALAANLNNGRKNVSLSFQTFLAIMVLIVTTIYAVLHFLYPFNPHVPEIVLGGVDYSKKLDKIFFTWSIPMKLFIYFGALGVLIQGATLLSSRDVKQFLENMKTGELHPLGPQGVLATIAKSLAVSDAEYYLRTTIQGRDRVVIVKKVDDEKMKRNVKSLGDLGASQQKIFQDGEYHIQKKDNAVSLDVPIMWKNRVIGGLHLHWESKMVLTPPIIGRIQVLSNILAPVIEDRRYFYASSEINYRLHKMTIEKPLPNEDVLATMGDMFKRTLSIADVGLQMDLGFVASRAIAVSSCDIESTLDCEALLKQKYSADAYEIMPIAIRAQEIRIGTLVLVYQRKQDMSDSPSLRPDFLFKTNMMTQISDVYIDLVRISLTSKLQKMQYDLFQVESFRDCYEAVSKAAKDAGLLWCQVVLRGNTLGDAAQVLTKLGEPIPGMHKHEEDIEIDVFHLDQGDDAALMNAKSVVRLTLPVTEAQIFFGASREGFGQELQLYWPWRQFLGRLGATASMALERIRHEEVRFEFQESRAISTAAVATGTIMHQIKNHSAGLGGAIDNIREGLQEGTYQIDEHLKTYFELMDESVTRLRELTEMVADVTKLDQRKPSFLLEALEKASALYEDTLARKGIRLEVSVDNRLMVDQAFHTVSLVLANLIGNSVDALVKQQNVEGWIKVIAVEGESEIVCSVIDNGPGIESKIRGREFKLNVSTKDGSHGLGLYLVERALREDRGSISVKETKVGYTEVEVIFPKPKKELNPLDHRIIAAKGVEE